MIGKSWFLDSTIRLRIVTALTVWGGLVVLLLGTMSVVRVRNNDTCLSLTCTLDAAVSDLYLWLHACCGGALVLCRLAPRAAAGFLGVAFVVLVPMGMVMNHSFDGHTLAGWGVFRPFGDACVSLIPALILTVLNATESAAKQAAVKPAVPVEADLSTH